MRPELLAPAGSPEKLRIALAYGADAVYCAGPAFGLRTASKNFTEEELAAGIACAHGKGAKVYVTVNVYPRDDELPGIAGWLRRLRDMGADAAIVSDPGVMRMAADIGLPFHVSTQANTVNAAACLQWHEMGASRVVLARELTIPQLARIRERAPQGLELEVFVHGAMCVSYSGRCLLSNYLTARDANAGDCAQPCRWRYALCEESRPGEFFPIEEDDRGSYILNSRDLCLIRRLPELEAAGVSSFKIEGRVKSEFYLAAVTGAYRRAIDGGYEEALYDEVCAVSHRSYFEGFAAGMPARGDKGWQGQLHGEGTYRYTTEFVAHVRDWAHGRALCNMRNRVRTGDVLEALTPDGVYPLPVTAMWDENGAPLEDAKTPDMRFYIACEHPLPPDSMLRRRLG
ncbi:MAG TPA: U32 family peptidase [Terriglobales bacterium]|nr:U32 family peptidase [Terriglobales bacterium]